MVNQKATKSDHPPIQPFGSFRSFLGLKRVIEKTAGELAWNKFIRRALRNVQRR